ncbi:antitermination protein, partial [Escherichia coli]|nr:antitermination protein [Escherichia coli]
NHTNCPLTDLGGKTCIFSHPVYLFLREFSLQDSRGGSECGGKGEVSTACKDCRGRGVAIHREESVKRGMPVIRDCQRCGGRGYERLPSTEAFNAICNVTDAISLDTWKKTVKRFYDTLVVQFDIEEAWAEQQLKKVTR